MADVLTPEQRRLNMSRIRGKDTKPELILRKGLHAAGFRYRLHAKDLPGRPDMVFTRFRAVIMVHGCFWHGHSCPMFKLPTTRREFWVAKIAGNQQRDEQALMRLATASWRVLTVWECSLKGPARLPRPEVFAHCAGFLRSDTATAGIEGVWSQRPYEALAGPSLAGSTVRRSDQLRSSAGPSKDDI
ncbi:DNA mismatch endonuclease Vsr [Lichenibacterium minor]|uniref:DNA mismatch endonuclease Vsr n=1 Tax=Lichenibacterium minor TaxID=2316528 RepID=A0A4V1RU86_9HYPH|nr:very short patch repair endonuclease [Lichenibacterium minor]RYC30284.1 DNA mismatch endonuclease Vsr [Lichenibacterium minor]